MIDPVVFILSSASSDQVLAHLDGCLRHLCQFPVLKSIILDRFFHFIVQQGVPAPAVVLREYPRPVQRDPVRLLHLTEQIQYPPGRDSASMALQRFRDIRKCDQESHDLFVVRDDLYQFWIHHHQQVIQKKFYLTLRHGVILPVVDKSVVIRLPNSGCPLPNLFLIPEFLDPEFASFDHFFGHLANFWREFEIIAVNVTGNKVNFFFKTGMFK